MNEVVIECPFCPMFADELVLQITPLNPVVEGHQLFIPKEHVADAGVDPTVTARVMQAASEYAATLPSANIITSKGKDATQSISHLHVHVVPRKEGDNLQLPWAERPAATPPNEVEELFERVWQSGSESAGGFYVLGYPLRVAEAMSLAEAWHHRESAKEQEAEQLIGAQAENELWTRAAMNVGEADGAVVREFKRLAAIKAQGDR